MSLHNKPQHLQYFQMELTPFSKGWFKDFIPTTGKGRVYCLRGMDSLPSVRGRLRRSNPWMPHVDNSGLQMKAAGSEESVLFISVSRTSQVAGF